MAPIRILVVDDSVVIRKVLCDALASDPAIEVVGTAPDGRIALAKITQLHPDLITLDVEMPNLSGLQTIPEIRKLYPKLPIIMFSTLTERGASTTLDALALGASDYVTKPSNTGSVGVTMERIKQDLIPKIKALCARPRPSDRLLAAAAPVIPMKPAKLPESSERPRVAIDILAIGTSTGGPNALAEVLPAIPADFPVPIVIVQHMPPLFTRMLAERLSKKAAIKIREGEPGARLQPGEAWIAPGDYHMTVERHGTSVQLAMNQGPPENSCRPAVDVLFRSVAAAFGANTLAVVMTGMGSDGVLGSQVVRERGGRVYVQDEATSVVWGMPGQVAAAGWADKIFPLGMLAAEIDRLIRKSRHALSPAMG
ncbi:MAG: chemotaxis response regulator protein-glutamate methylesterase [Candidatus Acidiferrum sp.]|jgi:two-component system chemotaxis response regulator CheB